MANEDHINLSNFIKDVHKELRESSKKIGADKAWKQHLKNKEKLQRYAATMRDLSINIWQKRNTPNKDRIQWTIECCEDYFFKNFEKQRENDLRVVERLKNEENNIDENWKLLTVADKLDVLDVGSCGNFFKHHEKFKITAIDIAPSSPDVLYCDFLSVEMKDQLIIENGSINQLQSCSFDVVIFSLLLEYLPSSEQRIKCCQQAYDALKTEGILIIITPDSSSQHKNQKLIKTWRWLLALMGFRRIKVEKLKNLSCLAFRKALIKEISSKWAESHRESYMENKFEIPQDRNQIEEQPRGDSHVDDKLLPKLQSE